MARVAAKRRAPVARAAVAERPRARRSGTASRSLLSRLAPSGRSLALGFAILAAAAGAYAAARETSAFAVGRIEVEGAPAPVAQAVTVALGRLEGTSLVALSAAQVEQRLARLPWVASWTYDRAFPHTLRVVVEPEQPLAVARRGADAWLVSARGKVLEKIGARTLPRLPRIWLAKEDAPAVNGVVAGDAAVAVDALAPAVGTPFLRRVRFVRQGEETLTLVLRTGIEVRLGNADAVRLKLEIARRLLPAVDAPGYLDLSVPERPVILTNSQLAG